MVVKKQTCTILSPDAAAALGSVLPATTAAVVIDDAAERCDFLLSSYPVRDSWADAFDDLETVYNERVKLWASIGAYEGLTLSSSVVLPRDLCECAVSLPADAVKFFSLSIGRDIRRMLNKSSDHWRLSFAPGAIIGASMHGQNLYGGSCACFGYDCEYEGTAAQMAYDPHLAVLERVDNDGKRVDGFQFVIVTPSGVHAYGGCYFGYDVDSRKAGALALDLARKIRGYSPSCDYAKLNNDALDVLSDLMLKTSDTRINSEGLHVSECEGSEGLPVSENWPYNCTRLCDCVDSVCWDNMRDIISAYSESTYYGGFWSTGISSLVRPFSVDHINNVLQKLGIGRAPDHYCNYCEGAIYFDDDDYVCGDDYGLLDQYFCSWSCLRDAMMRAADDRCGEVVLIDGGLYRLP